LEIREIVQQLLRPYNAIVTVCAARFARRAQTAPINALRVKPMLEGRLRREGNMENITYITGAGFSAIAGLPTMGNFLVKAKDLYYGDKEKYKSFKAIFEKIDELAKIKNYFNSDLFNIEEFLSIYDMEYALSKKRNSSAFINFIIDVITSYSFNLSDLKHEFPGNWLDFVFGKNDVQRNISSFVSNIFQLEYYDTSAVNKESSFKTRKIESNIHYSIVSLNYDSLLETTLSSINDDYNSLWGFEKEKYIDEWMNPMLFKLHGDVLKNSIIPPTWAKNINDNMRSTWQNAYEVIRNSTQIRFFGYSLPPTDTYFLYFLKAAIKNNPFLKNIDAICLDKQDEIQNRYKNVFSFRDLKFKNMNINDYCKRLWCDDRGFQIRYSQRLTCNSLESIHKIFVN